MSEETKKQKESKKETAHEEKSLDKMTVLELREIAKEFPDVTGVTAMKKDQLLEIIKKHRGIKDEKPAQKAKAKVAMSISQMKQKIETLKADKKVYIEKHDKKMATVLRRRIARLKKRIRKTEKKAA